MPSMVNVRKTEEKGNKKRRTVIKLICWNKKQEKNDYTFTSAVLWHFCIGDDSGCLYDENNVIIPSDKYTPKNDNKRANRIEWEHIVPAQAFGQSFVEWRDGDPECVDKKGKAFKGRNCARKASLEFRYMESDMYNLVPAVGEINGLRSNYSFTMIPGENREFGACDFEIEDRKAEPGPEIRGDIARTYFYMDDAYPGHGVISNKNEKLFQARDKDDPVDSWECERCRRIEKIQGNENRFIKKACLDAGVEVQRNQKVR